MPRPRGSTSRRGRAVRNAGITLTSQEIQQVLSTRERMREHVSVSVKILSIFIYLSFFSSELEHIQHFYLQNSKYDK